MSQNEVDQGQGYYEGGQKPSSEPVTLEEHVSSGFHEMGRVLPYADTVSLIQPGTMGQVGESSYVAAADHSHNMALRHMTAVPTDADFDQGFTGTPVITSIAGVFRIYVRFPGGAWKSVVVA